MVMMGNSNAFSLDGDRAYLIGLAYRMLGSRSDAEDVVQEALLRALNHKDELRTPGAFLTTVVTRLCLDELGSARRRRESYVGTYLPEPVLTDRLDASDDPTEHRENVSVALLVVLDRLSPAERAVFVLRDVFELDFEAIAEALARSEASCRKLLQRARQELSSAQLQQPASAPEQQAVSDAFFRALATGDLQGLINLLAGIRPSEDDELRMLFLSEIARHRHASRPDEQRIEQTQHQAFLRAARLCGGELRQANLQPLSMTLIEEMERRQIELHVTE